MKVSILCPVHRYGGLDVLFYSLEHQTFPKNDYEFILIDRLYKYRHHIVEEWKNKNNINIIHKSPKNESEYHVLSSILNEGLKTATGDCCIVTGDYTYLEPTFIERHYAHHVNGWGCTAPQRIFGLPKLKTNLKQCYSTFNESFSLDTFSLLPEFIMDMKLQIPSVQIDHRFCYNRNESFPREKALKINGWDERFIKQPGPANIEFYLRLIQETKCKFRNDPSNVVKRIMSSSIPPHLKFLSTELDDTNTAGMYRELCKKYGVNE